MGGLACAKGSQRSVVIMDNRTTYEICVNALKEYVANAGFNEVIVGLSGGLDSALTATMCVDALGASCVHGLLLPGPYSSAHSITDAQKLAENLEIESEVVSITEPYESFMRALKDPFGQALKGIAAENTQARCRMICLMAVSNQQGWMLINTSNKSETMMGYSTLYGDTAGAFAPLGGLYKTDVYKLAYWRNEQGLKQKGIAPIPKNTLEKPPSAELSPNQEDERAMGISYDELDKILIDLVERKKGPEEITDEHLSLEKVMQIQKRIEAYAFKRDNEPPFPCHPFYDSAD